MNTAVATQAFFHSGQLVKKGERLLVNDSTFAFLKGIGRLKKVDVEAQPETVEQRVAAANRDESKNRHFNRR